MKAILTVLYALSISYSVSAGEFGFTCQNGSEKLEVILGAHAKKSATYVIGSTAKETKTLRELVQKSEVCEDLSADIKVGNQKAFTCEGEMFFLDTIYSQYGGQFLVSDGGVDVLKKTLLPGAGYTCNP